ncbi:response regulator [Rhizobiaceae bacterium CRRU44]|uniref:Response regulator n=1 Tax=Ferranicluibacter rubi TaxID=2715133 RepID=A0AA44CBK9_9HYPH|nr:response regulator [Ferranicluibacter rubi]NHT76894.1 response regulator [Ferranicluibacter rubi]
MVSMPERRALVVDDEMLIAVDVEFHLQSFGFDHVRIFSSESEAISWLQNHEVDVVIMEVGLLCGMSKSLAELLVRQKTPFIVYSGYRPEEVDEIFRSGHWLTKPAEAAGFHKVLEQIFS